MTLRSIRVHFENGNTIDTNINGTNAEIERYYIGTAFQFGDTDEHPGDKLVKAVRVEFLDPPIGNDYHGKPVTIGDTVKNIESGWRGKVIDTAVINGDTLLVCLGVNWWTGEPDQDDKQWHAPGDVIKRPTPYTGPDEVPNPLNFM